MQHTDIQTEIMQHTDIQTKLTQHTDIQTKITQYTDIQSKLEKKQTCLHIILCQEQRKILLRAIKTFMAKIFFSVGEKHRLMQFVSCKMKPR